MSYIIVVILLMQEYTQNVVIKCQTFILEPDFCAPLTSNKPPPPSGHTDAAYAPAEHCCESPAPPAVLYCIWPAAAPATTRGRKNDTGATLYQDNLIVRADLIHFYL